MGITEFSCFAIKPGATFPDKNGDYERALELAVSQPGGGSVYYGNSIERPDQAWCFLDWDSVEDHAKYSEIAAQNPIGAILSQYLDWSKGFVKHIAPTPWPPTVLAEAPVVEVLTLFFPAGLSEEAKASLSAQLDEFKTKALDTSPDFKGISHGWSVEDDVPVTDEPGKTGNVLAAFIGWPSVEAHQRFRETEAFKDNIDILRGMKDIVKLALFHISCKSRNSPANK
ncbi:hypothetical protein ColTof4_03605 [Colletotrichum tofieldiae]|nr:hypothetical protein ColTof3_12972 [Colletotrichum tofieldiae]GKT71182.1 hypothetical protein ColTof4_03605 [Colletotrichum tofieldiae]